MKLVYVHQWGNESCSGTATIPFEYESKENFIFDLLEKYNEEYWKENPWNCSIFDLYVNKFDFDTIELDIFTLDEWFELNKEKYEN